MAEQLADLNKSKHIMTFEFNVSNVSVSSAWGSVYSSSNQEFDIGIDTTNKKVFVYFIPSTNQSAWIDPTQTNGTKLTVAFVRPSSGTINGKLYVMVTD